MWATLVLMAVSALCGAATDIHFDGKGYTWQLVNCLFTAAYALTLRNVMDKASFCDMQCLTPACKSAHEQLCFSCATCMVV